jgi:predicted SAM-dependent methyltransferase
MENELYTLSDTFKKYNLGCGTAIYKGFLNIGYWSQLQDNAIYKDINGTEGTFMLNYDLRHGVPARDGSLETIYHSHMLEHLSFTDGIAFIKECFRALKKNGVMRVLVPDLELWANAYVSNNRFFLEEYRKVLDNDIYVTRGAIFMGMLHNHEHKCGYDFETLKWMLEHAGFSNVKRTLYASSTIQDIEIMEPISPLRTMESLCVECEKF